MKCPKCTNPCIIYPMNSGMTMSASRPYYDHNGSYHNHDPNSTTSTYVCEYGHQWSIKTYNKCSCGWSGGETIVDVLEDVPEHPNRIRVG